MKQLVQNKQTHKITICTTCRHTGNNCRPGVKLIKKLQDAIDLAGDTIGENFEISGIACMAGCDRPCTIAYHASKKASYLFGDIDPEQDIEDLVSFARQYAELEDGWCSSTSRPKGLSGKTMARIPSAMIQLTASEELIQ